MELRSFINNDRTDKDTVHSYLEPYELLMSKRRDAKKILEIGVERGGSLLLWEKFFPDAEVWGMDIFPDPPACLQGHLRIKVYSRTNAYDRVLVDKLLRDGTRFDILIDDGDHSIQSMLFVAQHYSRLLAPGGLLVIEDIPNPDWIPAIVSHFPSHLKPFVKVFDLRAKRGRWDDMMIIVDLP